MIEKRDIPRIAAALQAALGVPATWGPGQLSRLGGLTNRTYHVRLAQGEYIVRVPGEGTEELIVRADEKASTELACRLGIDARLLYWGSDGVKVSQYIPDAVTMDAETLRQPRRIEQAAAIFHKLHHCGADTGVPFEVFDMAAGYEKIIAENAVALYPDYEEVKRTVMGIKAAQDARYTAPRVPCHNDPLCENWVASGEGTLYLIDWEYAGMNDGMWDLADLSIEASYGPDEDTALLAAYSGQQPDARVRSRLLASKIYLDYLWTLWGKTRVPFDGQPMEDYAWGRYQRLQGSIRQYMALEEG